MSIICWNCRGLGNPRTIQELRNTIRSKSPQLVFLCETKCNSPVIENLKQSFNFFGFSVDARGHSGGLALLWSKDIVVSLRGYSDRYIDVDTELHNHSFRFTGVYGQPAVSLRRQSWQDFLNLQSSPEIPWVMCGDFNEVLCQDEFQGSQPRAYWQMNLFRDTLNSLNMFDLGFEGNQFTWSRLRVAPHTQRARLDRAVCNSLWHDIFPWSRVYHCPSFFSDHSIIHLQIRCHRPPMEKINRRRVFRFEAHWIRTKDCEQVIRDQWEQNPEPTPLKLKDCAIGLMNWSCSNHKDLNKTVDDLKRKISSLKKGPITANIKDEISELQNQLENSLDQLDIKWKQRAKLHWYKEGDRNTKFFHSYANKRKSTNHIAHLKDQSGVSQDSIDGMEKIILNHFGAIFESSSPSESDIAEALARLRLRIPPTMLQLLT
ncbi:hypothetical protein DH2020_033887 [Rehmannia glutinosa]|uniref:Endonuclease/exonuclease/phosphatase domain-containing protein n=1 Tax=Rehmannia glutinosa TaxID=99300 RepID=A0ABR0VBB9_REHGL